MWDLRHTEEGNTWTYRGPSCPREQAPRQVLVSTGLCHVGDGSRAEWGSELALASAATHTGSLHCSVLSGSVRLRVTLVPWG